MGQLQQTGAASLVSVGGTSEVTKKGQFAHEVAFMLNFDNSESAAQDFMLVAAEVRDDLEASGSVSSVSLAHDGQCQGFG